MAKTLKFQPHLVPMVLSGEKYVTWRIFDDKDICVGDHLDLVEWINGNIFTKAIVVSVLEKPLKNIDEKDYVGHEKFQSEDEMYAEYRKYYGDQVGPDTIVKIIRFEILKGTTSAVMM